MASTHDLVRQVRLLLEDSPEALSLSAVLDSIHLSVAEWSSAPSDEPQILLSSLEDIYHDVVDHALFHQVGTLLAILYHLRPVIPAISIISTWFDLVLRPALREPKLPTSAVEHAKELILAALEKPDDDNLEKLKEFRRRLFDLYLLDAYNVSSGDDALEWAELDRDQRDRKALWKDNLQDVLIMFGLQRPQDLMSEIFHCFASPSSRLQLLIFLNLYSSQPTFPQLSPIIAVHPLLNSLILSLEVDSSSTACTVGLTLFTKLLPIFAVHAPDALKSNLPHFLAILARVLCWKVRQTNLPSFLYPEYLGDAEEIEEIEGTPDKPEISPNLEWQRLEFTFNATPSVAPHLGHYFTHLYYLFPCNVVEFIRHPVQYLENAGTECPYVEDWHNIIDEDQIRKKSEVLFCGHVMHPSLLSVEYGSAELKSPFWSEYDISKIVGESTVLDARNVRVGLRKQPSSTALKASPDPLSKPLPQSISSDSSRAAETIKMAGRHRISVHNIIATSVALKAGLDMDIDVEGEDLIQTWPNVLFSSSSSSSSTSPTRRSLSLPPDGALSKSYSEKNRELPTHVAEAVSSLQRRLLLSSNELNLELWLGRKNLQLVTHLSKERVLAQYAESERQGLHNKLREYKTEVARLQKELKNHKEQASSVKNKYADWNAELQQKLREFREQKRGWTVEIAELRNADLQRKATFETQGKLLASSTNRVFELETKIKETAHKIDRLHDYERQIEQLIKMQRLWEDDTKKMNEQAEQLRIIESNYQGLKVLMQSYQEGRADLETEVRQSKAEVQALESRLAIAHAKLEEASKKKASALEKASEMASLNVVKTNQRLREHNADLRDDVEELRAMIDVLKARGSPGLVREPSTSPVNPPVFSR